MSQQGTDMRALSRRPTLTASTSLAFASAPTTSTSTLPMPRAMETTLSSMSLLASSGDCDDIDGDDDDDKNDDDDRNNNNNVERRSTVKEAARRRTPKQRRRRARPKDGEFVVVGDELTRGDAQFAERRASTMLSPTNQKK